VPLILSGLPSPSWVWSHRHELDGVLTLQHKNEPGASLPVAVKNSRLISWHHPYTIKKWPQVSVADAKRFRRDLIEIANLHLAGKRILVHCAAGIHRTGTNAWAILVYSGASEKDAQDEVLRLRPQAADFVRFLPWARKNLLP